MRDGHETETRRVIDHDGRKQAEKITSLQHAKHANRACFDCNLRRLMAVGDQVRTDTACADAVIRKHDPWKPRQVFGFYCTLTGERVRCSSHQSVTDSDQRLFD